MTILGRNVSGMGARVGSMVSRNVPRMRTVGASAGAAASTTARRAGIAMTGARNYIGPLSRKQKIAGGTVGLGLGALGARQINNEISNRQNRQD
jgi:hypothetical protein